MQEKLCRKCNQYLPESEFPTRRASKDNLSSWCRNCHKHQHREMNQRRFAEGLCQHCNQPNARKGKVICETCQQKFTKNSKLREMRLKEQGLCMKCGQTEILPALRGRKTAVCEVCYFKIIAHTNLKKGSLWKLLQEKWNRQNQECPYTGNKLVLGENASIDHIFSKKRFPELRFDPNNLQWADYTVNRMKLDLTPDEFLSLIHQIAAHCKT